MRDKWIDVWKGWLILLVVIGHVVGGGSHFAEGDSRTFLRGIYFLIYSFHMSAFFFVAGWLWRRKEFGTFIKGRVKRLLVPYFIVGFISAVVYSVMHGSAVTGATDGYYAGIGDAGGFVESLLAMVHAGGWPNGNGFRFNSVLWFLPCLFTVEVAYWFVESRFSSWWATLMIAIVFLLLEFANALYGRLNMPWGIDELPRFMPWFLAGRLTRSKLIDTRNLNVAEMLAVAVVHVLFVWLYWNGAAGVLQYWLSVASIAAGILLSYGVAKMLERNALLSRTMAILGASSMSIMLWHKFFVVAAQMKCSLVKAAYGNGIIMASIASAVITIFAVVAVLAGNRIYDKLIGKVMHR